MSVNPNTGKPAPGVFRELKHNLDSHLFFWIALLGGLGVFFFVPQVSDIWAQKPPLGGGFWITIGYFVFLVFLLAYYLLSVFVVLQQFPIRSIQARIEAWVNGQMTNWQQMGRRRFLRPWFWISVLTWRLPDLTSCWLVAWASHTNRASTKASTMLHWGSIVLALLAGLAAFAGTAEDSSRYYPLSGVFCRTIGLWGVGAGCWLVLDAVLRRVRNNTGPDPRSVYFGRILAWVLATTLGGELLWFLAGTDRLGPIFSYRLYTIWAAIQVLTTITLVGLLVDCLHLETPLPVRQIVLVLLVLGVWWLTRAVPLPADDVEGDLTSDEQAAWREEQQKDVAQAAREQKDRNQRWFEHLLQRTQEVKEGPVVIVAASGGGSRAAIFTALAYETLAHTPLDPCCPIFSDDKPPEGVRTWADNVVLISSVSGGSLATAYFVDGLGRPYRPRTVAELRNTTGGELAERLEKLAERIALEFPQRQAEQEQAQGAAERFADLYLQGYCPQALPEDRLTYLRGRWEELSQQKDGLRAKRHQFQQKQDSLKAEQGHKGADPTQQAQVEKAILGLEDRIAALDDRIDVLERFLATVRAYDFVRALRDPQARARLTAAQCDCSDWVLHSRAFDEMCLDFMAPVMRGVLAPTLDRGDSLSRFWTGRFHWKNCTNLSGYCGHYQPRHPAVVFNACDVAVGSRLAVGFPDLPNNLWPSVYNDKRTSHGRPEALSEMGPDFPVSLARAVRMSSNFPFGFRVMELTARSPAQAGQPPAVKHVLDGGVVDNTGLDTVYELFHALESHAQAQHSPLRAKASEVLAELRQRGVVIFEIDAGAKPNDQLQRGLFSGQTEPIQALNNAAYTSADQDKALYLKETRRILNRNLESLTGDDVQKEVSLAGFKDNLPVTTLHLPFVCNHYQPGEGRKDRDVMTAWTLGPGDKAEVVHRFFIELAMWEMRRSVVDDDLRRGRDDFEARVEAARVKLLLDQLAGLNRDYQRLQDDISKALPRPHPVQVKAFKEQHEQLRRRYDQVQPQASRSQDGDVAAAWRLLNKTAKEVSEVVRGLAEPKTEGQYQHMKVMLEKNQRQTQMSQEQLYRSLSSRHRSALQQFRLQGGVGSPFDPQQKYDRSNKRSQLIYER